MDWDLTPFFPTFDGPERQRFVEALERDLASVTARASCLSALDPDNHPEWEAVLLDYEEIDARPGPLSACVDALASCDAADERDRSEQGRIAVLAAAEQKLEVE